MIFNRICFIALVLIVVGCSLSESEPQTFTFEMADPVEQGMSADSPEPVTHFLETAVEKIKYRVPWR